MCLPAGGKEALFSREDGVRLIELVREKNGVANLLATESNEGVKAACANFFGGLLPLLLRRGSLNSKDAFFEETINGLLRLCSCGAESKKPLLSTADQQQLAVSSVDALNATAAAALECGIEVSALVTAAPKLQALLAACGAKTQLRALALLTSILLLQLESMNAGLSRTGERNQNACIVPDALFDELFSSSTATYNVRLFHGVWV